MTKTVIPEPTCFCQRSIFAIASALMGLGSQLQAAEWVYPLDIASHGEGYVIADRNWPGVWQTQGGELNELFAASKTFKTPMNAVRCVAVGPEGQVYAGCSATRQVYRLTGEAPQKLAGDGVGIGIPMDIAVATDGSLYVSDIELHRIFRVSPDGGEPEEVAAIRAPRGVLWDDDSLLIVSQGENSLVRMSPTGETTPLVKGQVFNFPHEVAKLGDSYYVTDGYADGVWPVAKDGTVGEIIKAEGMVNPVGITQSRDRLVIIDPQASKLFSLTVDDTGTASIVETALDDLSTSSPASN